MFWTSLFVVPEGYRLVEDEDHKLKRLRARKDYAKKQLDLWAEEFEDAEAQLKELEG